MACNELTEPVQRMLSSRTSAEYLFEDFTDWQPFVGIDDVQAKLQVFGAGATDFTAIIAIQTAAVSTALPSAWATVGASVAGGSEYSGGGSVWTAASDAMWFRIGAGCKYTTGAAAQATVTIQAAWNGCGSIVASTSFQAFTLPVAGTSYQALTDWLPGNEVDAVKVAIEIASLLKTSGSFSWSICYRTATAEIETAGAWTQLSATYTDADTSVNTGELGLDLDSVMFVQIGLQYAQATSGSTRADFSATIGTRHDPRTWWTADNTAMRIPIDWGTDEGGTPGPTITNTRAVYTGTASGSNTFCNVYDAESIDFTIAAYAQTVGDPSGPGVRKSNGYWWIGYDAATGLWGVYTAATLTTTPSLVSGTTLAGAPNAIAKIVFLASPVAGATFHVSFDGTVYNQLYSLNGSWTHRLFVISKDATDTVKREYLT